MCNNLTKGRLVGVDGRLQVRSYEGPDGQRRYVTEVVADAVQFWIGPNPDLTIQVMTASTLILASIQV